MYFDNINLLRGFAALSVLVYHVIELYHWQNFPIQGPLLWFRIGWLGVDLFFVISGFVVTLTASQLFEKHGNNFYKTYLRRRTARIIPLYFLTGFLFILFCDPSILKSGHQLYKNLIYHLLFIHNLDSGTHGAIDGPNWSVGVEMQFYLLIMLTIRYWIRIHPGIILLVCILISWTWRALAFLVACHDTTCNAGLIFIPSTQLPGCLDEFGFGICLCRMVLDRRDRFFAPTRIFRSPWFWVIAIVLIAWPTFAIYWRWATYWEFWWMIIFWKTLSGMTFFAVLALAIRLVSLIKLNKFLFGPLWYLGEISYGIYLWHSLVIISLREAKIFTAPELLFWTLFFTIVLSAFSWHFVEKPLIGRFR